MMPHRTLLCRLIFCAVFSVSFINLFTKAASLASFLRFPRPGALADDGVFCSHSELADDVLVVLRTGATSSREKVPVHFRTTLRCVPHYVVFSDLDEDIEGHAVHDVLKDVTEGTRKKHDDFKLYHHLKEHGRRGVEQEVMTTQSGSSKGDYLNTDNAGWKLDKWKFLPMVDGALKTLPEAKWYVFIEDDTYLVWSNLLEYLNNFDAKKPYYIGKHLYINDIEFGYGGAGFILSNPAMRKVSNHRFSHIKEYEDFTASHWVGDCALGKVLEDVRVPLHKAFPHIQGDSPATMDPTTVKIGRDAWCYPAITYHHVSPAEIEDLWAFEQEWFMKHDVLLRHRDVFMQHVLPQLGDGRAPQWDNMSADREYNAHDHGNVSDPVERQAWKSFEHCHAVCEKQEKCIQFLYESGSCSVSYSFRLGYAKPGERIQSGWMTDRIDELFLGLENRCGVRDWFGPQEGALFQRRRV